MVIERIEKRNKKNLHEWTAKIDKWFKNFEDSGKNIQIDFIFNKKEDMPELLNKIDETLEVII